MIGWIRNHAPAATISHLTKAAIAVSLLIVGLAGATLWLTIQNGAQLDATRRFEEAQAVSDEITACRASFSALLVSGPTAAALKALSDYGAESGQYRDAADSADPERYIALAELSGADPAAFLRECHAEFGSS